MILPLTRTILTTAELVGGTPTERELPRTASASWAVDERDRSAEDRLRQLAAELDVTGREQGLVPWRRRPRAPHGREHDRRNVADSRTMTARARRPSKRAVRVRPARRADTPIL